MYKIALLKTFDCKIKASEKNNGRLKFIPEAPIVRQPLIKQSQNRSSAGPLSYSMTHHSLGRGSSSSVLFILIIQHVALGFA